MGMSDEEMRSRGQEAARLLDNAILRDAFDSVEAALVQKMRESSSDAVVLAAKRYLGVLADIRGYIKKAVIDGAISARTLQIDEERKAAEAKRRWWKVVGQ